MSKPSSRIPTFRSKLPQVQVKPKTELPASLTEKDIGKKVCVSGKEGVLRYIGIVHFAKGIWCGVELPTALGKNDGFVNGIRYFACPRDCGLMVPASEISLKENTSYDSVEDGASGPYSMLFIDQDLSNNGTFVVEDKEADEVVAQPDKNRRRTFVVEGIANVTRTIAGADSIGCCRNDVGEAGTEAKRLKTHSSEEQPEAALNVATKEVLRKPSSLPQLRSHTTSQAAGNFDFSDSPFASMKKFVHSTPIRNYKTGGDFEESLLKKLQLTSTTLDDDDSKRNSLEFEESLGILTPEQMVDGMNFVSMINSRTPSSECIGILPIENTDKQRKSHDLDRSKSELPSPSSLEVMDEPLATKTAKNKNELLPLDLPSPNVVDASVTDFSLGIIDEQLLSNLTLKTDTATNMELILDPMTRSKNYVLSRLEQTPSPEDLPLDPTPIREMSEPKSESSKSKTNSSFITSITSITSLDTGYQGDGEMSRPASRGADNSPLTRRPLPRPQARRPDPMTDSDFYTESDADNHEENIIRGDRRAQVIDGTLYGVDPQAAADIYVNNRENMDSSGIFTDIESNTRTEEDSQSNIIADVSPSDTSTKTVSGTSQTNLQEIIDKSENARINEENITDIAVVLKDTNPKKRNASSPANSSPSSVRSPRHGLKEDTNSAKKCKMPKREVTSKVKAMLGSYSPSDNIKKNTDIKKPAGRWDAVMSKISKTEPTKTNFKDVKSKVFATNVGTVGTGQKQIEMVRKPGSRQASNQKSPNIKARRSRARLGSGNSTKNNVQSSINSSLSDLSAAGHTPKNPIGSSKKRDVVKVTQVLTASKLSPRPVQQNTVEAKKPTTPNTLIAKSKTKNLSVPPKEKKQLSSKDCGKTNTEGGRTSPVVVRPPVHTRPISKQTPRVTEGLAILIQHLVFNVGAFQVPSLKRELQKFRLACKQLEEDLLEERANQQKIVEEERLRNTKQINELIEKHKDQLSELSSQQYELEQRLLENNETTKVLLAKQNEDKLMTLKLEFQKLQKTHQESLDIMREENNALREEIDEKNALIRDGKHESIKLKEDYEAKEMKLKEQLQCENKESQRLRQELSKLDERMKAVFEENARLKKENDRLLSYTDNKGISVQEVQSLRVVLELKQNEVADLRRALAEVTQRNELLTGVEERAAALGARCEDLQLQLQRKSESEQSLITENKKLQDMYKEEVNQKNRIRQYNEELQWKVKQNKEVVDRIFELAEESVFNRTTIQSSGGSFNERHNSSSRQVLERALSMREQQLRQINTLSSPASAAAAATAPSAEKKSRSDFQEDDLSPPNSPRVKGIVEKSDGVSYVLNLEESPDIVASRIVRRSFRNSTPPKTTPTKSPSSSSSTTSNKRSAGGTKNHPLSLSASASAILPCCSSTSSSHNNNNNNNNHGSSSNNNNNTNSECSSLSSSSSVRSPSAASASGRLQHGAGGGAQGVASSTPKQQQQQQHYMTRSEEIFDFTLKRGDVDVDDDDDDDDDCEDEDRHLDFNVEDEVDDIDHDVDVDLKLPALPSEMLLTSSSGHLLHRNIKNGPSSSAAPAPQSLPCPKHLAGEAMVSESNSEDESTSSSSVQL